MASPTPLSDPVDILVDQDTVWTTAHGQGRGTLRALPLAHGVQRTRMWQRAIDESFGSWIAQVASGAATARVTALAHLVTASITAADARCLPFPEGDRWAWRAAPGPVERAALDKALQACRQAGVASSDEALQAFSQRVVDTHVRPVTTEVPPLPTTSQQAAIRRWAAHVTGRAAANARLAIVLTPPRETTDLWSLHVLAIALDEPTTRLPWSTAGPSHFAASEAAWDEFRESEYDALRRAWGSGIPTTLQHLMQGQCGVADEEIVQFLDRVAPRVQAAGFDVIAPGGLLRTSTVRRRFTSVNAPGGTTLSVAGLGLEADIQVDGLTLTEAELLELAASKSELVAVSGRWLRIGRDDVARLAALARRLRRPVSPADLLADEAFEGVQMAADDVLAQGLLPARQTDPPAQVQATLRPYQRAGLQWLTWLAENRVGGILADDMGLGKTLQVLTWIAADHAGQTLVVCPVTLVDTWVRQAQQFTPDLRVQAFHGADRRAMDPDADVVVTTYGLLAREQGLKEVSWHRVVLDEAQAIKNPDTHAARAARALTATHRLVVTGTPVENHLGDLWSLLTFAQPGLLPRRKVFTDRYVQGDEEAMSRLRAVVAPFLLRRVKTDPGILPDLPDREVIRDDCTLTREQVGAYEAVVTDMLGALEDLRAAAGSASDPRLRRRAAVLGGITRLKQICVHPALLTESRGALGRRSGKVTRLVELCGQIVDEGQAVVVFSQFASFVPDLAAHLSHELGVEVATLTGSDSRTARARTVAAFSEPDGPPILIASLKAGGTGLTLVRANHVIHLDRWWNPAVEDQASDRVWRIGQNQKVSVHVLVCPGTLEDRIDTALRAKRQLAASVIRSTETSVTELTDAELTELVGLVRDEVLQ